MRFEILLIGMILVLLSCKGDKSPTDATTQTPTKEGTSLINDVKFPQDGKKVKNTRTTGEKEAPKAAHKHLNTSGLEWMNMDQLAKIPQSGSKLYLIDIYTEWCGWCKIMDNKTFADKGIQDYLRENFHLIKFNAERKTPVTYKNESYEWKQGGRRGNNELAMELLDGKMAYPALVYLDADLNVIKVSSGYKNPQQLMQELEIVTRS